MERMIEFVPLLRQVQEYISMRYAAALTDTSKHNQLRSYISKYLHDYGYTVADLSQEDVTEKLYREMAEFSIITPFLRQDNVEEININAWDDIAVTYTNGKTVKLKEHFYSPQHAIDIVKRLLHQSNMIIDKATPMTQGHLGSNIRITALITPLVDEAIGVSASIRLLHPSRVTLQKIVSSGMGTQDMIDFLCMCARYGISFVIAGVTSSGQTTLLNAIMTSMPNEKRIITIESGAREFDLVKKNRVGTTVNNVVHTLSRPSDNPAFDVPQELLVVGALRLNPHGIVIGEMRDVEAYAAVEASLTGHAVFSTVHAHAAEGAHTRISLLCQKRFSIDFNTSLIQAAQAFPIVVYCHKLENNDRKIMDMTECEILPNGERQYHTLFSYHITKNEVIGGRTVTQGEFVRGEGISPSLQRRLLQGGVPRAELERFCSREVAA